MLVSTDSTAAITEALTTVTQLILLSTALVPIVASAVCAKVFRARIPAAFHHAFVISLPSKA